MSDESFGLVDSFFIDDGELDGLSPQMCFVLGCEWHNVVSAIDSAEKNQFLFTVHAANQARLKAAIDSRGWNTVWEWPHDDRSEEWVYLHVTR